MAAALELNNLAVVYQNTIQALRGLSLAVPEGGIVALLGSNGAGKTTALKAIAGLLPLENGRIASGTVRFGGADSTGWAPYRLVRGGMFHCREGRQIFADMTVEENLIAATYALTGRAPLPRDFEEVYGYFPRLKERRRQTAGFMSGGEQQMLSIGRAIVAQPRLILLDEPSLGLAPLVVREIFEIIARINREKGAAMLVVEQNARIALRYASHGYILESGRIVIDGPVGELAANQDVRRYYLGVGASGGGRKSFRDVKHYKRAKAWLA